MGATAISMVIPSSAMCCNIASMSNRRCSRIQAPASSTVAMLSRPRMCEGGVTICKRSAAVIPRASRQCRTPAANDRWVWRTAFGKPVVPELKTSTASASGSGHTGLASTGVTGSSRCSIGISAASTGLSPTACCAPLTASALLTSAVFQAGLINTAEAPSCQIARTAKTNSGRLDDISATRWPSRTPRCARVCASPAERASTCDRVYVRSSNASTGTSLTVRSARTWSVTIPSTDQITRTYYR